MPLPQVEGRSAAPSAGDVPVRLPGVYALLRAGVATAILLIAGSAATAQQPGPDQRIEAIFADWSGTESPGCAVGVEHAGAPPILRAHGMADLEHAVPNTPATVFEAGSVSKQFTVAATVLLALDGKLSLDDEVRRHVPELPEYEAPLTLRHLIHHTSGLRDWGTVVAAAGWPRTSRIHTHAHALDVISRQQALNYAPGAEYSYTNSGYNLLAIIVERVSGQSFSDFSRERIFEPLGMTSTQWRDDFTRVVPGRATAYTRRDGAFHILMPFENVYGNGGLLTTVGDLLIWNRNLESGAVGGRQLIDELHRQGQLTDGREIAYAGGLMVGEHRSVPEVSHGGATAGYRAFLARYPQHDLSVALLCNTTNLDPGTLGRRTAEIYLEGNLRQESLPTAARVAESSLRARTGLYRNVRTLEPFRISFSDGALRADGRMELVPVSATEFRAGGRLVRFDDSAPSRVGFRATSPDGDVLEFEPVEEAAPGADELEEYQGRYGSVEADAEYLLEVEDGTLTMRLRPHVQMPLSPAYADAFTTPSGWLVRFIRDDDERVTGMSFGMGRVRDLRFVRK